MLSILRKYLESEKKDKRIFDIILYGSSTFGKEKPRDIDILVIFFEGSLKDRLTKIQGIKEKLNKEFENIDIKQILFNELFSSNFLARTGIFINGMSVFKEKNFCEIIGFKSFSLFWYNLKGLNHSQKIKFNYILAGRGTKGLMEELRGERLASGAVKIPTKNSHEFEQVLKSNKINYTKENILVEV